MHKNRRSIFLYGFFSGLESLKILAFHNMYEVILQIILLLFHGMNGRRSQNGNGSGGSGGNGGNDGSAGGGGSGRGNRGPSAGDVVGPPPPTNISDLHSLPTEEIIHKLIAELNTRKHGFLDFVNRLEEYEENWRDELDSLQRYVGVFQEHMSVLRNRFREMFNMVKKVKTYNRVVDLCFQANIDPHTFVVEDDQFELQESSASHSSTANQGPAKKGSVDNGPVDSVHIDGVDSVHNGPVDSVHIDGVDSVHFDGVDSGNFDPVDQDGTVDMSTVASVVAESTASVGLPTKRSVEVSMGSEWPMTLCKSCPSHGMGKATQASETEKLINLTGDEESPEPSHHQPLRLAKATERPPRSVD